MTNDQELASGARSVEAQEHAASGLTQPNDPAVSEREPAKALGDHPAETMLGELVMTMFEQGENVRVRAGSPYNAAELFEGIYDSAEDANYELQSADIVQAPTQLELNCAGIKLTGITAEQLQRAGLKRHHTAGL